jgi:dienelactone hydrolase
MKYLVLIFLLLIFPLIAETAVVGKAVEYRDGEAVLEGYLAYDDTIQGKRPGILVVHEWKGLNDYAKGRAEQLAQLGYVGFAIDMYGKGIYAKDHEEAGKLSGIYRNDRNLMRQRAKAAYDVLKNNPLVDPDKIAAIGYCFGGTTVLEMARAGFDLAGVVSFHGALDTPMLAQPEVIRAKVLVMHGADDSFVGAEKVTAFQTEMRQANADWEVVIFGDAVHSFTVPEAGDDKSKGAAYNERADKRSWEIMQQFFKEIFSS